MIAAVVVECSCSGHPVIAEFRRRAPGVYRAMHLIMNEPRAKAVRAAQETGAQAERPRPRAMTGRYVRDWFRCPNCPLRGPVASRATTVTAENAVSRLAGYLSTLPRAQWPKEYRREAVHDYHTKAVRAAVAALDADLAEGMPDPWRFTPETLLLTRKQFLDLLNRPQAHHNVLES